MLFVPSVNTQSINQSINQSSKQANLCTTPPSTWSTQSLVCYRSWNKSRRVAASRSGETAWCMSCQLSARRSERRSWDDDDARPPSIMPVKYASTTTHYSSYTASTDYVKVKVKVKVKEGHTPKERRRGAHLPDIGRWARRWIDHYCLWRMASATPDLRLPSQPKLILIASTNGGMARLSWPVWLVTYRDSLPARRRSPIQALTGPSVE